MYDGHEPEVSKARCDRVGIRDQDVGLSDMRDVRGIPTGTLTPFKSPCTILALWRYFSPSTASAS